MQEVDIDKWIKDAREKILNRLDDGTGRSMSSRSYQWSCSYRDPSGRECVVGIFLTEKYNSAMEGSAVRQLECVDNEWFPVYEQRKTTHAIALAECMNKSGIPADKKIRDFLVKWQSRHDKGSNWLGNKYMGPRD